jgi:DNA-binding LytR/AlgR family response regulator
MNVLIIEDELLAAQLLEKQLINIDNNINIISTIDSIEKSVEWFKNNPHPDLIFLDIQLSDGLSFNIFNQVEVNSPVIFTTAYDQYALKAFEINSIDYLLKPIDIESLRTSLKKYNKLNPNNSDSNFNIDFNKFLADFSINKKTYKSRFLINKGDSLQIVDINKIAYFYSEQKATFIITKDNKKYISNDSLDSIINNVDPSIFYRINRQFIVSINSIGKISNYFNYKLKLDLIPKTDNDNTVISRTKVKEFKEWLSK